MRNARAVVTGGAGFIGSNLAHELALHNTVIIIDDLSTGKIENIADLIVKDNVTFIKGSILDLPLLKKNCCGADVVFHHAAIASVSSGIDDPLLINEVNITGTLNILVAAKENKVKKLVFASSSSVYGNTPTISKREDMAPNPESAYAITKLVGEYYCRIFQQIYNLPTVCLRYFNVYGPRQNPASQYAAVIPSVISRILQHKSPIIYGDGKQTRDFAYVQDVVEANMIAVESNAVGVFNVGTGVSTTINKLAEIIMDISGEDLPSIHEESRPGDVRFSQADITKARAIGYKPRYCLERGLGETILRFGNAI